MSHNLNDHTLYMIRFRNVPIIVFQECHLPLDSTLLHFQMTDLNIFTFSCTCIEG